MLNRITKVSEEEIKKLFDWRNDPDTRANSINTEEVLWNTHIEWLKRSLENPKRNIFIYKENDKLAGTCKTDLVIENGQEIYELSWTVAPEWRGKGIGKKMLAELLDQDLLRGKRLKAVIKKGNIASIKMVEAFGFKMSSEDNNMMIWSK